MAKGLTMMDTLGVVGRIWGGWLVELYYFLYRKVELYQHLELLPICSFDFSNKDDGKKITPGLDLCLKILEWGSWASWTISVWNYG